MSRQPNPYQPPAQVSEDCDESDSPRSTPFTGHLKGGWATFGGVVLLGLLVGIPLCLAGLIFALDVIMVLTCLLLVNLQDRPKPSVKKAMGLAPVLGICGSILYNATCGGPVVMVVPLHGFPQSEMFTVCLFVGLMSASQYVG
ncbi:MAG: hypothetical protein AAFN70_05290 [Planctomycetota bacterium]